MGMAAYHFFTFSVYHRGHIKEIFLFCKVGMEHHLKKDISQFFFKVLRIFLFYGLYHFICFLDQAAFKALMGLFPVPAIIRLSLSKASAGPFASAARCMYSFFILFSYFMNLSRILTSFPPFGSLDISSFVMALVTSIITTYTMTPAKTPAAVDNVLLSVIPHESL